MRISDNRIAIEIALENIPGYQAILSLWILLVKSLIENKWGIQLTRLNSFAIIDCVVSLGLLNKEIQCSLKINEDLSWHTEKELV